MNRLNRTIIAALVGMVLCLNATRGFGQDAKLQLANLDKLSDKAARVTDVTLDGALLQFASDILQKADDGDEDVAQLKSIMKKLKGIYIKSFEFDEASQYTKADVESVRSQLTPPRWTKIVQSIDRRHNEHDEIYLLKSGNQVAGVVILVAEPKELTVVNIVGDVPIDKIAALEHHLAPDERKSDGRKQKKEGSHVQD